MFLLLVLTGAKSDCNPAYLKASSPEVLQTVQRPHSAPATAATSRSFTLSYRICTVQDHSKLLGALTLLQTFDLQIGGPGHLITPAPRYCLTSYHTLYELWIANAVIAPLPTAPHSSVHLPISTYVPHTTMPDTKIDDFKSSLTELDMDSKVYSESGSTISPLLARPAGAKVFTSRVFDSFRSGPARNLQPATHEHGRRYYDNEAAIYNTANSPLTRTLKGRHLQMIAIGGSIGQSTRGHRGLFMLT